MTLLAVDASVVLAVLLEEADRPAVDAMLSGRTLIAPEFMIVEVGNALWKAVRRNRFNPQRVGALLDGARTMVGRRTHDAALVDHAVSMALSLNHPIYDCLYLALAERMQAELVTLDKRLVALGSGIANITVISI
ncbi:MAG: type II toxin-antitoxin system VapC family toxin [Hyphomonadaceae bacterium]|nr:type II toxin-antitoxin system VapC family toxin [Hyphomonadaceae bacterium]